MRHRDADRAAPATILVAEDEKPVLEVVRRALEAQGYAVITAGSGTEVVSMARRFRPDVIVMEMMMPLLDGYASARVLRRDRTTRDIPIIAFNAPNGRKSIRPSDFRPLMDRIREALNERAVNGRLVLSTFVDERR